uniref:Conotoxin n=1 Tax=Conus praecellens TaxID=128530 RepID=A0A291C2L0_CONPC|nr:conotoxin [Conus praecellens]ATF27707.1 conotoxin [Conus praecellens]
MKVTYMMIVAVLFLTAFISITADDSRNGLENRVRMARYEMKNLKASVSKKTGGPCKAPKWGCMYGHECCGGACIFVCFKI